MEKGVQRGETLTREYKMEASFLNVVRYDDGSVVFSPPQYIQSVRVPKSRIPLLVAFLLDECEMVTPKPKRCLLDLFQEPYPEDK